MELQVGEYTVSTDKTKLELDVIHGFLFTCYWSKGVPREVVARSLEHSLCFGVYKGREQVGLARVVTDYATFVYVADVFVLEVHRGRGLSVALMDAVVNHPDLAGVRTWLLLTSDAHGLYRKFGFEVFENERVMRRKVPYPYRLEEPL